jgi:hypothetical protein
VLILNGDFVKKYKDRVTIDANYIIDRAHAKPNAPSKDADTHVAGRSPADIGLATVAEIMNAAERPDALAAIHSAEGTGQTVKVTGVWRIWPEHGGDTAHTQFATIKPFNTTNPDHVFEIHPITEIAGIDMRNTLHPIEGCEAKEAEQAFTVYERTRSRITPMAGMNYVKFQLELRQKPLAVTGGHMAFAKASNGEGHVIVQKRRVVFVAGTAPDDAVKDKGAGDCLVVLGIPRIDLSLVYWRVQNGKQRPEVLTWGLPYEIVVVGVYEETCGEADD